MATKFKMPDNKTTIAIVTAIVLLFVIAITGTVVFLNDKGKAEAADVEKIGQQDSERNQEQQINEQGQDENQEVNQEHTQVNEEQIDNQQTADTTVTINQNTETVRTDNIQESTIERVETVEIPEQQVSEGHYIGWIPMEVTNSLASSQINVTNNNDIKITKKATTKSGENLVTNGEEITYSITVKNNGIKGVGALEVKDRVPENTTYVKNSAVDEAEEVVENENVIGLVWKIDLKAGEEKTVSFRVTVNANATGVIKNVALANGETTNVVENSIVGVVKTATIDGKKEQDVAKVGDKITYTITVKNTGNVSGRANVQDTELQNLINNKILEIDEESKEIANKLIEGTTVDVPASDEGTISFTAKVINASGAIKNIAVVGESKSEVTIETDGLVIEKDAKLVPTKKAYKDAECMQEVDINNEADNFKPGETVYYKLSVTNEGKVAGNAILTDDLPSYLENYAIVQGNANASLNLSKVTWNVTNLNVGVTESIIVKGTVKQIIQYKDLSTRNGSETETTARLFVRKDGKIPYEGTKTPYSTQLYTGTVGTVYLKANQAVAYGDLSKSDIYDLINRNNNIMDMVQKGVSFNDLKIALARQGITLADDEVIIWYVIKKEDDGWHIDGAIRKISDLQKVTNILNMVQAGKTQTATADIKLSTIATNIVRENSIVLRPKMIQTTLNPYSTCFDIVSNNVENNVNTNKTEQDEIKINVVETTKIEKTENEESSVDVNIEGGNDKDKDEDTILEDKAKIETETEVEEKTSMKDESQESDENVVNEI